MSVWPSTLPTPLVSGYSLKPVSGVTRTEMESGPARQRRRFTQAPTKVPVQFEVTLNELATFQAWWKHEIHDGADWFDCTLINGLGLASMRSRFIANNDPPYEATPQGNGQLWLVKGELEVEGAPILTPAQLAPRL